MVCIPNFVLRPEPVFDNLYGRGIKALSSGVSLVTSLSCIKPCWLDVCVAVPSIAGIYLEDLPSSTRLMISRFTNKAVVIPAAHNGSKPIYIPAKTKYDCLYYCLFGVKNRFIIDCIYYSCIYSVLIMHRRTDLWGPDGKMMIITISLWIYLGWWWWPPICVKFFSTRFWSWSIPGLQSAEIPNSESIHFLSFQRRTSYMSRSTGI